MRLRIPFLRHLRVTLLASVCLISLCMAMSFASIACAQRSPIEEARARMEAGQVYYLQARFAEAGSEFEAAFALEPFAGFLFNAGVAYENAGELQRSVDFFGRYLELEPRARDRARVQERVQALRTRIAAASAIAATGETPPTEAVVAAPTNLPADFKAIVSVRTTPEGARVTVRRGDDVVAQGPSPFGETLDEGEYRIQITHPDFNTAEADIRVERGKVYVVVLNLSQGQFLGYLRVVSDVPGAQVFIDDRSTGARTTPYENAIPVGHHEIWIEKPGYVSQHTEVDVTVGEDHRVDIHMERVDFGRVTILTNMPANVSLDGRSAGNVADAPLTVEGSPGTHRLQVSADGMKTFEANVEVRPGQLTPLRVRLRPAPGRAGAWVTGGLAAVSYGAAAVLMVMANERRESLEASRRDGTLSTDDARFDEGLWMTIGADSALGLGIVFTGLSIYYFLVDDLPPSEGSVLDARDWALTPYADPRGGAGASFRLRF